MSKKVKFTLPVNAHFGGARHLGGGVFVALEGPAKFPEAPLQRAPCLLEGTTKYGEEMDTYTLERFDDPHDKCEKLSRRVQLAQCGEGVAID